jgi:hypothetical protein
VNDWRFFGARIEAGLNYALGSRLGEKEIYRWEPLVVRQQGFLANQFRQTLESRSKRLEVCRDCGILRVLGPIRYENRYWVGWKHHMGRNPLMGSAQKSDPAMVIAALLPLIRAYEAAHQTGLKLGIPDWNRLVWDGTGFHLPDPWIKDYLADPGLEILPGISLIYPPEYFYGAYLDLESDLFCLGVLLYSAISGKIPYLLKEQWPTQGILRGQPVPLLIAAPEVNPEFNQMILNLLSPKPELRPSAREVRLFWEKLITQNRSLATVEEFKANCQKSNRHQSRLLMRKRWARIQIPFLATITGILLLWGGHWYLNRPSPPATQTVEKIFLAPLESLPRNTSGSRRLLQMLIAEKQRRILSLRELINQPYLKVKSIRVLSQSPKQSALRLTLEWRSWNHGVWTRYTSIETIELKKYRRSWKIVNIR